MVMLRERHSIRVYFESIKPEPKIRGIYECRCDERLQTKTKEFTRLPWELEAIGDPSKFRFTRKADALARMLPHFDFSKQEKAVRRKWKYDDPKFDYSDWTPEVAKKRSVSLWACKNKSLIKSLYNLPVVPAITGIKTTALGGLLLQSARYARILSLADLFSDSSMFCLLRIDEAKANIKLIYECRCNERL
jgi:hypothetical protein